MSMAEPAFPRGGARKDRKRKIKDKDDVDDLLGDSISPKKKHGGKSLKKKRKVGANQTDDDDGKMAERPLFGTKIALPTFNSLKEGMVILGCVQQVADYKIHVSLPGGLTGHVEVTKISDQYTKLLKNYAKGLELDVPVLQDLYAEGDIVCCKIIALSENTSNNYKTISLSLNPRDVSGHFLPGNFSAGVVIPSAVESVEDYGYMMSTGIEGLRSFIKMVDAESYINQRNRVKPLSEGQVVLCSVKEISGSHAVGWKLQLSLDPQELLKPVEDTTVLLPGTVVKATIVKLLGDGLVVKVFDHIGKIPQLHLKKPNEIISNYNIGDEVTAIILYVEPPLDVVTLSLNHRLLSARRLPPFNDLKSLTVVERVTIMATSHLGVRLQIGKTTRGFCHRKELKGDEGENVSTKYGVGTSHKARIIAFHALDDTVIVSLSKSQLEKDVLGFQDIVVGAVMDGTIVSFTETAQIRIKLGDKVQGIVHNLHTGEYPLSQPDKKYKIGQKLKCRVLSVDNYSHHITLTLKKSLLNSELPILSDYADALPGYITHGVVCQITQHGLLVVFFNNVKGFMSFRPGTFREDEYYIGQVIPCRVYKCNTEDKKLYLWISDGSVPSISPRDANGLSSQGITAGTIMKGTIKSVTETGCIQVDLSNKAHGLVDKLHFAKPLEKYVVGQKVKCRILSVDEKHFTKLTLNKTFLKSEFPILSDYSVAVPGLVAHGMICFISDRGFLVVFFNQVRGFLSFKPPKQFNKEDYSIGQVIACHVLSCNSEKKKIQLELASEKQED